MFDTATDRCLVMKDRIETGQGIRKAKLDAIDGLFDAWRNESGMADRPRAAAAPATTPKPEQHNGHPAGDKATRVAPQQTIPKVSQRNSGAAVAQAVSNSNPPVAKTIRVAAAERPVRRPSAVNQPQGDRTNLESELRHARFLTKAGLGPIAVNPLQQIISRAPDSAPAREAQRLLETLPKAK
jgi:hypothetical protein